MKQSRVMTIATVVVVVLILAAALVIPRLSGNDAQTAGADIDYASQPYVGDPNAPAKVTIFFDFLCPHCASFSESVTSVLKRDYVDDGQAAIYFVNFLVIAPQGMSRTLAMVGECVNRQGSDGFGILEPVLLRAQGTLNSPQRAYELAEQFVPGLDRAALEECVEGNETAALVDEDVQLARRLGVTGTPSVFVNGQLVSNATLTNVRAAIEDAQPE